MASCFARLLARCLGKDAKEPAALAEGSAGAAVGGAAVRGGGGGGGGGGRRGGGSAQARVPAGPPPPLPLHERCVCEGAGIGEVAGFAGRSTFFSVACLRDGGNGFESFVPSNLLVEITGVAVLVPTVADSSPGARVSYTARKSGTYMISVRYFAEEIPGSPFKVEILPGKIDGRNSSIEHPDGTVQGVMIVPLFMECRVKVTSRDKCGNERIGGGLSSGFKISTQLLAEDMEESSQSTRIEQEDRAWRLAREKPDLAGPLRKRRFGGFAGWEALHFCLAGDALFYSLTPSDSQPRGTLYLEGCRVKDTGNASFEVFVPMAYSRANLVKEKQVNRVFNFRAGSREDAGRWMSAIEKAKPLTDEQLLQERDGHKEGRGFQMDDINKLRAAIAAEGKSGASQLDLEREVHAQRVAKGWRPDTSAREDADAGADAELDFVHIDVPDQGPSAQTSPAAAGGGGEGGGGGASGAGTGLTSKQARVQAAMRDPSLTPQERQQRIREIMAGPAEAPPAAADPSGAASTSGGVTLTKQERVRAVMQDTSLSPAERQKRIQLIMKEPAATSNQGGGGGGGDGTGSNEAGDADRERLKQAQVGVRCMD